MTAQKKQWQTPQLTVLVRSRAEEAVLAACKGPNLGGPGRPAVHACAKKGRPCSAIGAS